MNKLMTFAYWTGVLLFAATACAIVSTFDQRATDPGALGKLVAENMMLLRLTLAAGLAGLLLAPVIATLPTKAAGAAATNDDKVPGSTSPDPEQRKIAFERAYATLFPGHDLTYCPETGYKSSKAQHAWIGWEMRDDEPDTAGALAIWELEAGGWETLDDVAEFMMTLPVGTRLYYLPSAGGQPRRTPQPAPVSRTLRDMQIAVAVRYECLRCTDAGGISDDVRKDIGELNLAHIVTMTLKSKT